MACFILYNPLAGACKGSGYMEKISAAALAAFGDESATVIDITTLAHGAFFADKTEEDKVILCGGDGTLNRFANDTVGLDIKCDILYYAMGTGNDFLKDIGRDECGVPFSVKKYLKGLPVATVNGKSYRFLNNVGFGIDGYCCEVGDRLRLSSEKPVNYTAIAIKGLLFHYKPTNATVTVDGVEYRYKKVWLAPTMKGRYYGGGMMAAPAQDRLAEDGSLSVMLFHGKGRLSTLMAFPSIFKGEHVNKKNMVAIHTGRSISVKFDSPAPVQIDGETILGVTEYNVSAE